VTAAVVIWGETFSFHCQVHLNQEMVHRDNLYPKFDIGVSVVAAVDMSVAVLYDSLPMVVPLDHWGLVVRLTYPTNPPVCWLLQNSDTMDDD
jgi:hypothetical protein